MNRFVLKSILVVLMLCFGSNPAVAARPWQMPTDSICIGFVPVNVSLVTDSNTSKDFGSMKRQPQLYQDLVFICGHTLRISSRLMLHGLLRVALFADERRNVADWETTTVISDKWETLYIPQELGGSYLLLLETLEGTFTGQVML